jgi:hypothetical protein
MSLEMPMESPPSSPLRRRNSAADYLTEIWGIPTSPRTLAKKACVGGGPPFRKAGRVPLYADEDLDQYAREKIGPRVRNTSELEKVSQRHRGVRLGEVLDD